MVFLSTFSFNFFNKNYRMYSNVFDAFFFNFTPCLNMLISFLFSIFTHKYSFFLGRMFFFWEGGGGVRCNASACGVQTISCQFCYFFNVTTSINANPSLCTVLYDFFRGLNLRRHNHFMYLSGVD